MKEWICAGDLVELKEKGHKVVEGILVIHHEGEVVALDNRCPHMGFPLHMGSLCDGILTCHWHHARFDVKSGGTLDPWADDATTYPVEVRDGEVWVLPVPRREGGVEEWKRRLRKGLEQNLSLVIAKAVVGLIHKGVPAEEIARIGVEFGTTHRRGGWRSGLTILTAMMNVLPKLDETGRILALYQGLVHVAREAAGAGTRFLQRPLPVEGNSMERLAGWYRRCLEVRDTAGAERVLLTAVRDGATERQLADMMMTAVTDHFYMNGGHALDFHNKAFEMLAHVGEGLRNRVLTSLLPQMADAVRSEELHSWQSPVDLVTPLETVFAEGLTGPPPGKEEPVDEEALLELILSDRPLEMIDAMAAALKKGLSPVSLARLVALAAAERIARFHVQNDFSDWITALHTFTHAHAVHESLRRSLTPELTRAVFHGAVSVYLDRFLNVPAARLPRVEEGVRGRPGDLRELLDIMEKQQQVKEAAEWVAGYLSRGGEKGALFQTLGHALLREDAEFHTFQMFEAALVEHDRWAEVDSPLSRRAQDTLIIALTRYLAAHAPTAREMAQTAHIALRLHRGEKLFEDSEASA
ncbi:Rieske (2Fe-2S) protein [Planifilum fimeticola]